MTDREARPLDQSDRLLNEMLRKALATPPISNEDILKRSKESHRK
jgi:hypothetical protein